MQRIRSEKMVHRNASFVSFGCYNKDNNVTKEEYGAIRHAYLRYMALCILKRTKVYKRPHVAIKDEVRSLGGPKEWALSEPDYKKVKDSILYEKRRKQEQRKQKLQGKRALRKKRKEKEVKQKLLSEQKKHKELKFFIQEVKESFLKRSALPDVPVSLKEVVEQKGGVICWYKDLEKRGKT